MPDQPFDINKQIAELLPQLQEVIRGKSAVAILAALAVIMKGIEDATEKPDRIAMLQAMSETMDQLAENDRKAPEGTNDNRPIP